MTASMRYELRLEGRLDQHWSSWLGGMAVTHEADGTTALRGVVADQSELHGLLTRVRDLGATLISVTTSHAAELSRTRLRLLRAGYLLMGVGLALVKWPLLPEVHTLPLYEGVTVCLLAAMSLLAFLGLRHPVRLVPLLLFESVWKLSWLCLVALPKALDGSLDAVTARTAVSCCLVAVVLVVIPWRYVWRTYGRGTDVSAR
ncbi:hypothetical protein [Jiangella endophytica]|uniref:hypothetical protein n=1 Tax=Jiangella endophytica TaxID=1623398 RepID=UPI0018E54263|nr:hypothetical protein [Jiangella endophytica]